MKRISLYADSPKGLSDGELFAALDLAILSKKESLRKVLLLPPDFTRFHSGAGKIVEHLYHALKDTCTVDIMPALARTCPSRRRRSARCSAACRRSASWCTTGARTW